MRRVVSLSEETVHPVYSTFPALRQSIITSDCIKSFKKFWELNFKFKVFFIINNNQLNYLAIKMKFFFVSFLIQLNKLNLLLLIQFHFSWNFCENSPVKLLVHFANKYLLTVDWPILMKRKEFSFSFVISLILKKKFKKT